MTVVQTGQRVCPAAAAIRRLSSSHVTLNSRSSHCPKTCTWVTCVYLFVRCVFLRCSAYNSPVCPCELSTSMHGVRSNVSDSGSVKCYKYNVSDWSASLVSRLIKRKNASELTTEANFFVMLQGRRTQLYFVPRGQGHRPHCFCQNSGQKRVQGELRHSRVQKYRAASVRHTFLLSCYCYCYLWGVLRHR